MLTKPSLTCPNCAQPLEYHVTIEMVDPPIGKIDTGYCSACACLFERIRETNTFYDSTPWPPLCRTCRQPVSFSIVIAEEPEASVLFYCRQHPAERWTWTPSTERWKRSASPPH